MVPAVNRCRMAGCGSRLTPLLIGSWRALTCLRSPRSTRGLHGSWASGSSTDSPARTSVLQERTANGKRLAGVHAGGLRYALVSRPTESPDEELARDIVAKVLGVPVKRFEDGTAPGQVDALIHYADREAPLEVVADHDPDYNGQQDALRRTKDRIEVSGLRKSWMVLLSRKAKINNVKRALPALLLAMQDNPPQRRRPFDEPSQLDRLGITKAWPLDRSAVSGRVWLVPQAWGGFAGTEDTVGEWVTEVLRREADVPRKLADHPDVAERHAFIWATVRSPMEVQTQLEPGDDHPFPVTAPTLPEGVTHVWVAGQYFSQGALAWFPDRGWWRTSWLARHSAQ